MKQKTGRKLLGFLLALAMVVGLMPGMGLTAYAATSWSESFTTNGGTIDGGVTVSGSITLTIPEGKTLTVNGGINASGNTLTVAGTGTLIVKGADGADSSDSQGGVGGSAFKGNLIVNGATVNATGGTGGNGGNDEWSGLAGGNGGAGVDGSITVQGGSALMNGGSGGNGGVNESDPGDKGRSGKAVTGIITGSAEESTNNSNWTVVSGNTSDKQYVKVAPTVVEYPLWVGGTQVTSANAGNIDGNNKASYNAETQTLTLNGYSYTGQGYGDSEAGVSGSIYAGSGIDLKIVLSGTNSVAIENPTEVTASAIYTADNLTITGSGSINAKGAKHGFYSEKTITISGGNVTAESPTNGISGSGINISGGIVRAKGDSIGISTPGSTLSISGGEVTAEGKNHAGLVANTFTITGGKVITSGKDGFVDTFTVNIEGGELVASGEETSIHTYNADDKNVKNAIAGTGWSDTAGTQGKTTILISTEGQNLSRYKKVQFPAVKEPSTVTKIPEAKNLTYTGSAQALVEAGTASGGTMQYALGTKDAATGTYSASIPTGTEAGTYHVWYKVEGDANHNDSEARCVTATIAKKAEPTPATVGRAARPSTQASPAKGAIAVSWKAAAGARSYQVQWRAAGASKWTTKSVRGRKYTITGLRRGTAYQVRVRGVSGAAKGDWSKASSRWLKAASKVRAATGKESGTVRVSWARDAKANAGCRVYVYAKRGGKPIKTIEVAKGKTATTVKGLKPGKTYYVRVRPYRKASGTTFSGAISGYRTVRAAG